MTTTLSSSLLPLSLPSTRMSVDFSSLSIDPNTLPPSQSKIYYESPRLNTTQRSFQNRTRRQPISKPIPLPQLAEEPAKFLPQRHDATHRQWTTAKPKVTGFSSSAPPVSRSNSGVSIGSSVSSRSTNSTAASSVFSHVQSVSTSRTSSTSWRYSNPFVTPKRDTQKFFNLPLSIIEEIFSEALCLPLTVSIGPLEADNRHMQHRYHRDGLDYVDIQLIMKHPLFLVSHKIRGIALDVLHRKCDFVVDLRRIYHTRVASTVNDNLKKHMRFWMDPPQMVRQSLCHLSRLRVRLPVPCCEAGVRKGRDEDDWMDASDGKGGGSWRVKSLKKEENDALMVQKCLDTVTQLLMTDPDKVQEVVSRSRTLDRKRSFRRTKSARRTSSPVRRKSCPGSDENGGKRKPLKRLDVILVKRSSHAVVLPNEALELVRALRGLPVTGYTRYFFEIESQQLLWAVKQRKKWLGFEPDGPRLLGDLQALAISERPIEPIQTPAEPKSVKVNKNGTLRLKDAAVPKTPISLEQPTNSSKNRSESPPEPSLRRRTVRSWLRKKVHEREDSFGFVVEEGQGAGGFSGATASGKYNPPTVEELRKIAEDIRNGLY